MGGEQNLRILRGLNVTTIERYLDLFFNRAKPKVKDEIASFIQDDIQVENISRVFETYLIAFVCTFDILYDFLVIRCM